MVLKEKQTSRQINHENSPFMEGIRLFFRHSPSSANRLPAGDVKFASPRL
jgi:hypothetical protein